MDRKNRFGEFIFNLRTEKGISLEQLSDGLCDLSLLSRYERGEREADKLLQNRLLTRLGTVPENYENFLDYKDYERWEKRQNILQHILQEDISGAKVLLEKYRKEYKMSNALEQQFYLAMLAQIRRYEGCDMPELAEIFRKALSLTVPDIDRISFRNRVLSLEELNLLLEYRYCSNQRIVLQFYETLLDYIEKNERTLLAKAKIYPKTVYYYYDTWRRSERHEECMARRMLELCDKAIELLRDANRMFYLWELFCMKEELVPYLPDEVQQDERFQNSLQECNDWKETLEALYLEYGISIAMYEFCYLYVESENYCIGDVIRIRRKMLGLSQEKLCDGICDSRTVSRLEHNKGTPQKEIVQLLFERLNLSTELFRTELVTDSQEAVEKFEELGWHANNRDYKMVHELLDELKGMVSLACPSNMQAIEKSEYVNMYKQGIISKEEFLGKMKTVLEYTVPYKVVISSGEKFLTKEELVCIQNIFFDVDWTYEEMQECIDALTDWCDGLKFPANYARVYEFIMMAVGSKLGDKGEYEKSNQIMEKILKMDLLNRRIKAIDSLLYGILWNTNQKENDIANNQKRSVDKLIKCILMCAMSRKENNKKFYTERLKNIEEFNMSVS